VITIALAKLPTVIALSAVLVMVLIGVTPAELAT
jgi:hypothetical protein